MDYDYVYIIIVSIYFLFTMVYIFYIYTKNKIENRTTNAIILDTDRITFLNKDIIKYNEDKNTISRENKKFKEYTLAPIQTLLLIDNRVVNLYKIPMDGYYEIIGDFITKQSGDTHNTYLSLEYNLICIKNGEGFSGIYWIYNYDGSNIYVSRPFEVVDNIVNFDENLITADSISSQVNNNILGIIDLDVHIDDTMIVDASKIIDIPLLTKLRTNIEDDGNFTIS